jgi:hypothetical protein
MFARQVLGYASSCPTLTNKTTLDIPCKILKFRCPKHTSFSAQLLPTARYFRHSRYYSTFEANETKYSVLLEYRQCSLSHFVTTLIPSVRKSKSSVHTQPVIITIITIIVIIISQSSIVSIYKVSGYSIIDWTWWRQSTRTQPMRPQEVTQKIALRGYAHHLQAAG